MTIRWNDFRKRSDVVIEDLKEWIPNEWVRRRIINLILDLNGEIERAKKDRRRTSS